jgi:hypothetical protein
VIKTASGLALGDVALEIAVDRQTALEPAQDRAQHPARDWRPSERAAHGPDHALRRALARAIAQVRRIRIGRLEEAEVVEPEPDLPRQLRPAVHATPWRVAHREPAGMPGDEALDHLAPTHRLLPIDSQVHLVAPDGEGVDRRLEVAEVGPVPREEQ